MGDPRVISRYYGTIVNYSGYTGTCWGVPPYYGTIVTPGILVCAGVYLWVTHGKCWGTLPKWIIYTLVYYVLIMLVP